jgi:hypothetical protein
MEVKAPVGITTGALEVLEGAVPETDADEAVEVWLDEAVGRTVPFLMYKVSRLPAPVDLD